jgi:hypothetical protein
VARGAYGMYFWARGTWQKLKRKKKKKEREIDEHKRVGFKHLLRKRRTMM